MVFTLKHQEQKRFITLVPLHGKLYSTVNPQIKTPLRLKIPNPLNKLSLLFLLFFLLKKCWSTGIFATLNYVGLHRRGNFNCTDIFVLGPQWAQQITGNAFWVSFQLDWQINNGFISRPIMASTHILVHKWGPELGSWCWFQMEKSRSLVPSAVQVELCGFKFKLNKSQVPIKYCQYHHRKLILNDLVEIAIGWLCPPPRTSHFRISTVSPPTVYSVNYHCLPLWSNHL